MTGMVGSLQAAEALKLLAADPRLGVPVEEPRPGEEHLVADTTDQARHMWVETFSRERADLGPAHARDTIAAIATAHHADSEQPERDRQDEGKRGQMRGELHPRQPDERCDGEKCHDQQQGDPVGDRHGEHVRQRRVDHRERKNDKDDGRDHDGFRGSMHCMGQG